MVIRGTAGKFFPPSFFLPRVRVQWDTSTQGGTPVDGQKDLRVSDLLRMQEELQEKYKGIW